ncbi:MAG: glutathione peroxidase [Gammaproteobacteria bacterium]|nr:MAG: glutathione peroxidase [Pseudomonadota bacterium]PIE39074.1 MAG: glutathione peroxidase [Gammaproteobacteria bacterium]
MSSEIFNFNVEKINGNNISLSEYKGKVLLIVNTASKCGFTPQFKGLEALYEAWKDQGLVILGFPCNQFLNQDPGSNSEIGEFCSLNYGVTFPMFAKIEVNGDNTHPLYRHLKKAATGLMGSEAVKWNFTKFLVDQDGNVKKRYAPNVEPKEIEKDIRQLLS